jgi:hypothetical protein
MRIAFVTGPAVAAALLWASAGEAQDLGPRTLLPVHVLCTDVPAAAPATPALTVAAVQVGDRMRFSMGEGETAVVDAGTQQGIAVGQRYVARRPLRRVQIVMEPPDPWMSLHPSGILTITAVDERFALARVDSACDAVEVGDYLEALAMPTLPAATPPGGPGDFDDRATVLFGKDRRRIFGDGDLLSIDRGAAHGVTGGVRFLLYRDRQNGLPLVELGEAVVVDVAQEHSRAVVVRVLDFVAAGDVAVKRAATP